MLAAICVAAFFERMFWLTKLRFSLAREDGLGMLACQESRPQHPYIHRVSRKKQTF